MAVVNGARIYMKEASDEEQFEQLARDDALSE